MRATSFLVGVFLIFGALEVRRTSCYMAATPESDLADTIVLPGCNRLDLRERCIMGAQSEYRTFDGTCNNLCNITNGAAGVPFSRLPGLEPPTAFAPGFKPRVASVIPNKVLQPSRKISTTVFTGTDENVNGTNPNFTHVTMTWGQFIDHDVTLTPLVPGVECGSQSEPCQDLPNCVNIPLVKPLANNSTLQCIPLRRALQDDNGEQQNIITSYVDASMVYGSSLEAAEELRDPENPKLLAIMDPTKSETEQRCALLPPAELEAFCRSPNTMDKPCFKAGDERVNENQALMAMHTLWVREHNRIARKLAEINPTCDDEEIYQLARKIVAAEIQHITYNEWLTVLFSAEVLDKANLTLVPPGEFFKGYDPSVDATIHNSFGAAVLRIGHTLIRSSFNLIANSKIRRSKRRLYRGSIETDFFTPQDLFLGIKYNFIDEILHGLTVDLAQLIDNNFVTTITENLVIEGPIPDGIVGDLTAINIERGRDHGLPPYVNFREFCGAGQAKFFPDLLTTTTQVNINKLKQVYATVLDIDLFPGGLLEFPAKGSAVGFTYTCLLTEMFKRLRFGDRFWYERDNSVGFTLPQLDEIRKASLARVYCDNTASVIFIQPKVFVPKTNKFGDNPVTDCDFLPMPDLEVFKKEPEEPNAEVPAEVPV